MSKTGMIQRPGYIAILLLLFMAMPIALVRAGASLSLQEVVHEAIGRNPSAGMERQKLRQLEAEYRAARAGLLPHLSANASYIRLSPDRLSMTGQSGAALYEREAYGGIGLSQLLFDGKTNAIRNAAGTAAGAQETMVSSTENLVAYQAARAFVQVVESRALLQTAEQAVERARTFEAMTSAGFKAGKVTRLDLLQARSGRLEADAVLVRAKELGQTAVALLAAIIGREQADFTVDGRLPEVVSPVPPEPVALDAAMEGNLDMQRMRKLTEHAGFMADAARGALFPSINAKAGWGYRDRDIGGGAREWTVGLQLDLPICDGGALHAGVARAEAALAESREAERSGRLAVQSQLRRELSAWRTAAADVVAADDGIVAARESLDAAQALYLAGKATALDVLTAQLSLARAENGRTSAFAAYAIARAGIDLLNGSARSFTLNSKDGTP